MYDIGCDQHKHYCLMAAVDEQGKSVSEEKIYHNNPTQLEQYLSRIPSGSRIAIEACGFDAWLCDRIESYGHEVHLAHPLKTRAIAEAKIKTDVLDARTLAKLLHGDLLAESYYAPAALREKRYLLRYRQCLVVYRTGIKNRIHSMLHRQGILSPGISDLFGVQGLDWLQHLTMPPIYSQALNGYLSLLQSLKKQLNECEKEIRKILKDDPQSKLIQTIPGIGKISAFLLLAEIGPLDRFRSAEKLCSYAGIVPSYHQSGQVEYRGSITKQGNKFIRWILVEAAHIAVRKDPALKEFYQRIRYKKGTHKATVAVARKLLTYVYYILKRQEPYRYQPRNSKKPVLTFVSKKTLT